MNMMRYGRLRGTMEQCLREIQESQLPGEFLLTQVRSLVRYLREVDGLCGHIKKESGWESDTTAYLEILCAKEDSTLVRRVSDTRILKQVGNLCFIALLRALYQYMGPDLQQSVVFSMYRLRLENVPNVPIRVYTALLTNTVVPHSSTR